MIFGSFQKLSKFLTKNSVINTGNFVNLPWPTEALFERFRFSLVYHVVY